MHNGQRINDIRSEHSAFRAPQVQTIVDPYGTIYPFSAQLIGNGNVFDFNEMAMPSQARSAPVSPAGFEFKFGVGEVQSPEQSMTICNICEDKATGKHYGARSCDGCKGFFRRTVRKNQRYYCRFEKRCCVARDKRNSCRFCRYQKCLDSGMKTEAVQNERDSISNKKQSIDRTLLTDDELLLERTMKLGSPICELLQAERACSQQRHSVINHSNEYGSQNASIDDISSGMRMQLLMLVEWAKAIEDFSNLALDDRVALLRAYSASHLVLSVAQRSLSHTGLIPFHNHMTEIHQVQYFSHVVTRILDEVVEPMKQLQMDDNEIVCLKAVSFFNPNLQKLVNRTEISRKRRIFSVELESYVNQKTRVSEGRLSDILLLLPSLASIGHKIVDSLQVATLFGIAKKDNLVEDMLIQSYEREQRAVPLLTSIGGGTVSVNSATTLHTRDEKCIHSLPDAK